MPQLHPETLAWASETDVGLRRPNNEDARRMAGWTGEELVILPKHGEWKTADGDMLFAVSDGMGGQLYGERASQIAIDVVFEQFAREMLDCGGSIDNKAIPDFLDGLIAKAHDAVNLESDHYPECEGMGATLTMTWLRANGDWWLLHLGDSRFYRWRQGTGLAQVSHDHNYAGFLHRKGRINERELRNHPTGHALTQALGGGLGKIFPQIERGTIGIGDRFLVCSDGLNAGLWDKNIASSISEAKGDLVDAVHDMLGNSLKVAGHDNITLILGEAR